MECPSCAAQVPDGAAECPACGILFEKWREKKEREKRAALANLGRLEAGGEAPALDPVRRLWLVRAAAAILVLAWLGGFAWYYFVALERAKRELRAPRPGRPERWVEVTDPKTGRLQRVPVFATPPVPGGGPPPESAR
ncbi:MAG: hypothetical protein KGM24_14655 [Elusimicrobia bacterium]|nr:hypothetical protein [Elusimicrobiota bacterium]